MIVDELHAFAGDDRGWHLLAVLARIAHLARRDIQRIGLSATIGNPQQLIDWLCADSKSPRRVIIGSAYQQSLQVNWQVDDIIGDEKRLDFRKSFLPEVWVDADALDFLSEREKLAVNHIRTRRLRILQGYSRSRLLARLRRGSRSSIWRHKAVWIAAA